MRGFDKCMAEIIALIHEAREINSARGEDAVGWEIILGLIRRGSGSVQTTVL